MSIVLLDIIGLARSVHKYMSLIILVVAGVIAYKTLNPVLTLVSTVIFIAISRFVRMLVDAFTKYHYSLLIRIIMLVIMIKRVIDNTETKITI